MKCKCPGITILHLSLMLFISISRAAAPPSPSEFFGFIPGEDRKLIGYSQLIDYLKILANQSTRLKLVEIGASPMGKPIYIAVLSSSQNLDNIDTLKSINRRLALNGTISEKDRRDLAERGRVFLLTTLSMHSNEVGPTQASPSIAHFLVTDTTKTTEFWLQNTVLLMVPCHNPDGMDMIVDFYKSHVGTKYEGCSMPGVYHKYIGHDNNRDFITLSQSDTRAIAGIYNKEWFPQIVVEKHQMGKTGTRYFVPPAHDPIAENIPAGIWNWTGIFGSNMIKDMTANNCLGVSQHNQYDEYWPGGTTTCLWENAIGMLTECASANIASPVYVESSELRVHGKGLAEYKKSINMPAPWPGGWWTLGDIVKYEIESTKSLLETASLYRREILRFQNEMCHMQIVLGQTQPPYYYILPVSQHDKSELVNLVNLLMEHGVFVYTLKSEVKIGDFHLKTGDIVIPTSQPFRAFIKEVLERQRYPERHYTPDGKMIKPYDITSWSLPLHRGVTAHEITIKTQIDSLLLQKVFPPFSLKKEYPADFWAAVFTANHNDSYKAAFSALSVGVDVDRLEQKIDLASGPVPAGSFLINNNAGLASIIQDLGVSPEYIKNRLELKKKSVSMPRIALVETYFHDMDAGWTRFVFDRYHIPFEVIRPGDFGKTKLDKKFDTIIFPDADKSTLLEGKFKSQDTYFYSDYPPEYTKGIGKEGMNNLMTFLHKGGSIIAWGRSTGLFTEPLTVKEKETVEEFRLPVIDISSTLVKEGLFCPGSLIEVHLTSDHPLTLGLPDRLGVFYNGQAVFQTSVPSFDMDRRIMAKCPEREILLSGYIDNEKALAEQTLMVWLKKGKGQLVLFGFHPQFRASTQATYKLLFNAILLPKNE